MKRKYLLFTAIITSFLFFSCQSFRVIDIETYNPSAITFPPEIKTVMIINNSAQQPDNIGHRYASNLKSDSVLSISADSSAYIFCKALGKSMVESTIFDDVRMCEDTLRRDSLFYDVKPFSARKVRALCDDYGVDGIISLDKLFFSTVYHESMTNSTSSLMVTLKMQISGEVRVFWPGQKEALVVPFIDSLSWYDESDFFNEIIVALQRSEFSNVLLYFSEYTGQNMHINFVPFWAQEKRWYYTAFTSEWKRGTAYAAAEKWENAAEVWEPLYGKMNKWKQKAQLASNLAVCYEITGDFKKAVEYAEISHKLFKENDIENSPYTTIQNNYIELLKKRIDSDKILMKQLNEREAFE